MGHKLPNFLIFTSIILFVIVCILDVDSIRYQQNRFDQNYPIFQYYSPSRSENRIFSRRKLVQNSGEFDINPYTINSEIYFPNKLHENYDLFKKPNILSTWKLDQNDNTEHHYPTRLNHQKNVNNNNYNHDDITTSTNENNMDIVNQDIDDGPTVEEDDSLNEEAFGLVKNYNNNNNNDNNNNIINHHHNDDIHKIDEKKSYNKWLPTKFLYKRDDLGWKRSVSLHPH